MKTDEFENKLKAQPIREVPAEWREQILAHARSETGRTDARVEAPSQKSWWQELLWPCPQAWAGLACAWMVIFAIQFSDDTGQEAVHARTTHVPPPELRWAFEEQQRLLAELAGPVSADAEPPRQHAPGPRSERRALIVAA